MRTVPNIHSLIAILQIVRWRDVRRTKPTDPEDLIVASHVNLLPTEDTLTISDLVPGSQYQVKPCPSPLHPHIRDYVLFTHITKTSRVLMIELVVLVLCR